METPPARSIAARVPLPSIAGVQGSSHRAGDQVAPGAIVRETISAGLRSPTAGRRPPRADLVRNIRPRARTAPTVGLAFECCAHLLAMGVCAFVRPTISAGAAQGRYG